jgi:hypothetical protein
MNSPFLVRNIIAVLLLTSLFAGSLYLLLSKKISDFIWLRSKIFLVLYRAATTIVFAVSTIGLLCGIWLFYTIEFNDVSRDCWRRGREWQKIVPGMAYEQAAGIMGKPVLKYRSADGERATYCIDPIGDLDSGTVVFVNDPNGTGLKVSEKTPSDQAISESLSGRIPEKTSKTYANYAGMISDSLVRIGDPELLSL